MENKAFPTAVNSQITDSVTQANNQEKIAVVGLGYVGLPLAVALAKHFDVKGLDNNVYKLSQINQGIDPSGEVSPEELRKNPLRITTYDGLSDRTMVIIAVPTPIDRMKQPDLTPVLEATKSVAQHISPNTIIIYESTFYPGLTQEVCRPALEKAGAVGFHLGYSPERINPGDKEHTLESVVKIISAEDKITLTRMERVYSKIVKAGLHLAPSIKVAEAAKIIENTQRDLNIALMNELALICDRLNIPTRQVLEAAGTKWNFLHFTPGLCGGHCIAKDPYYLTAKAQSLGYHPEVILAGRRINDSMGKWIAQKCVKMLATIPNAYEPGMECKRKHVGIFGITFKEDVPDIRNSRVPEIFWELRDFGIHPIVFDPLANPDEVQREYGIVLSPIETMVDLDCLIVAVPHTNRILDLVLKQVKPDGLIMDVKSALSRCTIPWGTQYWSL